MSGITLGLEVLGNDPFRQVEPILLVIWNDARLQPETDGEYSTVRVMIIQFVIAQRVFVITSRALLC